MDQADSNGVIHSSSATVIVTVIDVNDNTPTFPPGEQIHVSNYYSEFSYTAHEGSVILTVSEGASPGDLHTFIAIDNDGPSDGVVQYSLADPPVVSET